jgi:phenylacetate-CoA ligase
MTKDRAEATRREWLATLEKFRRDPSAPATSDIWSPSLECASRDEISAIQSEKLRAAIPFLYENSGFYRARFDRLGQTPADYRSIEDLEKWPVVDKSEMMADVAQSPPWGNYTTVTDDIWAQRGWMLFSSSGSTGTPRPFRYTHVDRVQWAWANARGMHAMGFRRGESAFIMSGYGPHVFAWGVQVALETLDLPCIPGGGMDARARANVILRFKPTILVCTPSYALHLARVMQSIGYDPAETSVHTILIGGEPAMGIDATRKRIESLWNARLVEFYGCTEVSPHVGGYSCLAVPKAGEPVATHVMEDIQIWETVDPETRKGQKPGERGLTVCTSLNSESSPQLRFLVGDYATFTRERCACGRTHARAVGSFAGRSDDLINLRGIKMYPVQVEEAVRAVPGIGDEYEIVLMRDTAGLDTMTIVCEHADHAGDTIARKVADEVRLRCEIRVDVTVNPPDTLPKTEFKAKRVRDLRGK